MKRIALALLAVTLTGQAKAAPEKPTRPPAAKATPAKPATAPGPTSPGLDLAYGAYQRGLYVTAYREATARLDKNPADAPAMTLIGELYNQGLGVKRDWQEAASWYRLAAARGDSHAMATLGLMALEGRGMTRDDKVARDWFEKAAAKRQPMAAYNLALVLLASGAEEDIARAARLLVIAAEAEIADAQHALGVMHARGQGGVAHDPTEAVRMFLRATRNGSLAGEVEYAIAVYNGAGVPKNEVLAARHFRHAAARGNAIAQNRLARLYVLGRGVPKNLVEAAAWHAMSQAQGLDDGWLDQSLAGLSPAERAKAKEYAAERSSL